MNYTAQHKKEFLSFMRMAIGNKTENPVACSEIAWEEVFRLSEEHHVLPLVVNAVYQLYGTEVPWDRLKKYKKRAERLSYLQTIKTDRFLSLYRYLTDNELAPIVIKGLICRDLYPNPDFRFSADEDLLILPDQTAAYHEILLKYGLKTDSSDKSIASEPEISYRSEDGVLFLEVHRFAFPPDSAAYGEYNSFFDNVFDRAVTEIHSAVDIRTMAPTDHLLYLICHSLKHFLHGGCGIRQVCDIGLYAQKNAEQIDWLYIKKQIDSISAWNFMASLFTIAEQSLGIDLSEIPEQICSSEIDPEALLDDILDSGVYGSSTMSRKHSAAITLYATESKSRVTGKKSCRVRTLFPSASSLAKRYPYLIQKPWLLPIAWLQRIYHYIKSLNMSNTPSEALRIGRERVGLLKQYGLLSDPDMKMVDTSLYLSALSELVEQGHEVCVPVAGSSMTPFLGDGRDQVFVTSPTDRICKGDIVLYRRINGNFVLHRVYRIKGNGNTATYDMIGDAQNRIEHGIQRKQILAVATKARRKGIIIDSGSFYWWFFQHIWISIIPFRRLLMKVFTAYHYFMQVIRKERNSD